MRLTVYWSWLCDSVCPSETVSSVIIGVEPPIKLESDVRLQKDASRRLPSKIHYKSRSRSNACRPTKLAGFDLS